MYKSREIEEMSKEAEAIAELFRATYNILELEMPKEPNESNIIHVDFGLKREFEKAKNIPLKLPQILEIYHDWAFRTYELASVNRGHLKNKKIREMVELNHAIVGTIIDMIPSTKD